jgi:hypothetical protein
MFFEYFSKSPKERVCHQQRSLSQSSTYKTPTSSAKMASGMRPKMAKPTKKVTQPQIDYYATVWLTLIK